MAGPGIEAEVEHDYSTGAAAKPKVPNTARKPTQRSWVCARGLSDVSRCLRVERAAPLACHRGFDTLLPRCRPLPRNTRQRSMVNHQTPTAVEHPPTARGRPSRASNSYAAANRASKSDPWLEACVYACARLLSMAMHAYARLHPNTPHACVRLGSGTQRWTSCTVMHRFSAEKKLVLVE